MQMQDYDMNIEKLDSLVLHAQTVDCTKEDLVALIRIIIDDFHTAQDLQEKEMIQEMNLVC
jgi:hypothetical protein